MADLEGLIAERCRRELGMDCHALERDVLCSLRAHSQVAEMPASELAADALLQTFRLPTLLQWETTSYCRLFGAWLPPPPPLAQHDVPTYASVGFWEPAISVGTTRMGRVADRQLPFCS